MSECGCMCCAATWNERSMCRTSILFGLFLSVMSCYHSAQPANPKPAMCRGSSLITKIIIIIIFLTSCRDGDFIFKLYQPHERFRSYHQTCYSKQQASMYTLPCDSTSDICVGKKMTEVNEVKLLGAILSAKERQVLKE